MSGRIGSMVGAIVLLAAAGAQASTVTFSYTAPGAVPDPSFWSTFLDIQRFDPAAGTLNSATLSFTVTATGAASIENLGPNPGVFTLGIFGSGEIRRPDNTFLMQAVSVTDFPVSLGRFDGVNDFGGSSGASFPGLVATQTEIATILGGTDLALLTGIGTVALLTQAFSGGSLDGPGGALGLFATGVTVALDVTYDFTPAASVPLPASLALFLPALLGFAAVQRGRRTTATP